jgi:molybdopterin-guanine dinucleotide biosynthesis protein A
MAGDGGGSLGGIVLAGGAGLRAGGPKAGMLLAGRPLVAAAVERLLRRCDSVVVVSRPGVPLPTLAAPVLFDRPGPAAPLVGIATGLGALRTASCLVLACDLPFADAVLDRLIEAPHAAAVAADSDGRIQPLCARYPREAGLAACEALLAGGRLAAQGLAAALEAVPVPAGPGELLNVNTPEDLAQAEAAYGEPPGSTSTTAL